MGLGDEALHRDGRARRGGGGRARPGRARRPARLDGAASARTRLRTALRRAAGDLQARQAADLLQHRHRGARSLSRGEGGDAFRRLPLGGGARAARAERHRARGVGRRRARGPAHRPARIRPGAHGSDPCRAGNAPRGHHGDLPGPRMGSCPTSGATSRSTGASASRSAMRRSRTGPARATRPARSGTSAGRGASSGSTRRPALPAPRLQTGSSASGRRRRGRRSPTPFSRSYDDREPCGTS